MFLFCLGAIFTLPDSEKLTAPVVFKQTAITGSGQKQNEMTTRRKTGEAVTILFLVALGLLGVFGAISLIPYLSFTPWQWNLLISWVALFTNGLLCSMQVVVILRLSELRSDHINHYDVEKVMRRIVVPEQIFQVSAFESTKIMW